MRRVAIAILVTSATVLAAAAVAYADTGGLTPPDPHSPNASRINDAYEFIAIFTGLIFLLVEGSLVVFVVKYRRGRRARTAEGPQIHGSGRLEVIWTVLPVFVLAAIGVFVFYKLPGIKDVPKAAAADRTTITIEGHQFYWLFRYPNGAVAIDAMRAPAGRVVVEKITAPEGDVIHSWWVPRLGGKQDAIPGKVNTTWFRTNDVGRYEYRCAELCGVRHALMNGYVEVMPKDEFDRWASDREANPTSVALGKEEWQGVCQKCHALDERVVGPALRGNPLLADRKGIETLVRNGRGLMPAVGSTWTDDQIDALVAYTKRFAKGGSSGG
ncbi:MAG TPA: cytochrome c oxidase subunit II [Gaiellaceae bacterium]